jgi:hypothetical protein
VGYLVDITPDVSNIRLSSTCCTTGGEINSGLEVEWLMRWIRPLHTRLSGKYSAQSQRQLRYSSATSSKIFL